MKYDFNFKKINLRKIVQYSRYINISIILEIYNLEILNTTPIIISYYTPIN